MSHPELYVLRHGETHWNAENRMQGELNSPLTDKGIVHAQRQRQILDALDLSGFSFMSSPQGRAFQTAGIALAGMADHIRTDDRLREIGVGDWSGLLRDDLPMPEGKDPFMAQYEIAPNGEGFARLKDRCRALIADIKGPTVLVTHGITSMMIRGLVVGEKAHAARSSHGGQGCVYHLRDGVQKLLR
jgi:probable phosphoglycerate mutase